jgi:tetratricopeptide (TPR) repeat protein
MGGLSRFDAFTPRSQDSMIRRPSMRRRSSFALPWPAPRAAFTFLSFLLAVLALALVALLAPGAKPADAAVFMSEVRGAHFEANAAARVELNRMKSRLRLNNLEGAMAAVEAAVQKDSLSAEVWEERGVLAVRLGRYGDAYQSYNRAAVLAPDRAPVWVRLAQVAYMHLGLEEQGTMAIDYALAIDSLYSTAWYTRSLYHWTRAELELAEAAIQRARSLETEDARALVWYSTFVGISLSRGQYAQVATGLATHLYGAPTDLAGREHYAHALRGYGNLAAAKSELGIMLGTAPSQPTWLVELGLVLRAEGKHDSALVYFDRALKVDSLSFDAGYNRALERAALGDTAGAWRELRRLRGLGDDNFLIPLLASRLARAGGDSVRTRIAFEEARRLNPALGLATSAEMAASPIPAWASPDLAEGERLMERGEFTLAGDRFAMAAQDPVRRAAGLYWSSRVGRMTGAARGLPVIAAQAGAEASRGDPVIIRALAEAQWAAGDPERAIHNLRGLRKVSPDDAVAAALLSDALLAVGDAAGARAVWNEVAQESTRSWRIETSRAYAFAAVKDAGAAIARQRAAAADYLAAAP